MKEMCFNCVSVFRSTNQFLGQTRAKSTYSQSYYTSVKVVHRFFKRWVEIEDSYVLTVVAQQFRVMLS